VRFSNKTIAELCRALGNVVNSHAEMDLLFLEHDLSSQDCAGGLQARLMALVNAARRLDRPADERVLTALAQYALERGNPNSAPIERLAHALSADGLEWREGRLVPTTPGPAALATELSMLEQDLQELGLNVAAKHYRQAHESFVAGNWEAANAQIRPFMENLLIELSRRQTSNTRGNAAVALQDLRDAGFFDQAEWQMLKGFWQGIQDNGPHHGLSHEQEALFRLHVATSVARYSIHKLRAATN